MWAVGRWRRLRRYTRPWSARQDRRAARFPMIVRVHDYLRKRRCEFHKPVARVTDLWIRYLPDVEAWPWPHYPELLERQILQSEKEKGAAAMSFQFEAPAALIEGINDGK